MGGLLCLEVKGWVASEEAESRQVPSPRNAPENVAMNHATPLSDDEVSELEQLLDSLPAPLEPLDISALDGYLCGVLLQPRPVPAAQWLRWVGDVEGQALPPGPQAERLALLAQRRHADLDRAIAQRQWFDPWVFEVDVGDEDLVPSDLTLPWVAGFAAAMDRFDGLMALDHPGLLEPLAVLYAAFDPDDLEDADELLALIETLEPPSTLAEAVEDLVRSVLLLADVSRPRPGPGRQEGRRGARGPHGSQRKPGSPGWGGGRGGRGRVA